MNPAWLAAAGTALSIAAFLAAFSVLLLAALFLVYAFSLWRWKHLAALVDLGLPNAFNAELSILGQKLAANFGADEGRARKMAAIWQAIDDLSADHRLLLERVERKERGVAAGGADEC